MRQASRGDRKIGAVKPWGSMRLLEIGDDMVHVAPAFLDGR